MVIAQLHDAITLSKSMHINDVIGIDIAFMQNYGVGIRENVLSSYTLCIAKKKYQFTKPSFTKPRKRYLRVFQLSGLTVADGLVELLWRTSCLGN